MKISEIYKSCNLHTGKDDVGYLEGFYDNFLTESHYDNILEIGCKRGHSIALWKKCFPASNVFGIDIKDYKSPPGATKIIGDAYSDQIIKQLDDNMFDLIIDDGPHTYDSFKVVINKYHSKLKKNGILIIEDILRPTKTPMHVIGVTESQQQNLLKIAERLKYKNIQYHDLTGKASPRAYRYNHLLKGLYILTMHK